jgi:hypothetical protein
MVCDAQASRRWVACTDPIRLVLITSRSNRSSPSSPFIDHMGRVPVSGECITTLKC